MSMVMTFEDGFELIGDLARGSKAEHSLRSKVPLGWFER